MRRTKVGPYIYHYLILYVLLTTVLYCTVHTALDRNAILNGVVVDGIDFMVDGIDRERCVNHHGYGFFFKSSLPQTAKGKKQQHCIDIIIVDLSE